jgi:hypothetical protein
MQGLGMTGAEINETTRAMPPGPVSEAAEQEIRAFMAHMGLVYDPAWRTLRVYDPADGGHQATVLVLRAPARFYRVVCPDAGVDLTTGSDMGELATALADALARDLIGPTSQQAR